jgi:hypothetical protein
MAYSLGDGGIDEMKMHLGRNGVRIAYPGFKFAQVDALDHNFTSAEDRALLVPLLRDFILDCAQNDAAQDAPAMALAAE